MPSLAELQLAMGRALLARDSAARALPADWFDGNGSAGLKVHRNTIVGACCTALRLCYPTLERVLGAPMFDSLAAEFARAQPPAAPALDDYGALFGGFVAEHAAATDAALLRELASYDWVFERVAHAAAGQYPARAAAQLDGGLGLYFDASLQLFATRYAVERMRAGEASSTEAGERRTLALWRRAEGVAVIELRAAAAAFVSSLLRGTTLVDALAAAAGCGVGDEAAIAAIIAADVLQSGFVHLTMGDNEHGNGTEH
jgi:hypothetical protein